MDTAHPRGLGLGLATPPPPPPPTSGSGPGMQVLCENYYFKFLHNKSIDGFQMPIDRPTAVFDVNEPLFMHEYFLLCRKDPPTNLENLCAINNFIIF